jgi:hypothetical protein
VTSRKYQDLSFFEVKRVETLKDGSKHTFSWSTKVSNQSKVICEQCSFAKLLWQKFTLRRHQTNFRSGANTTWENLKEGVWRLGSANTLSRPTYKILVCDHVLNTIQNIIRDAYIYVKPMYSIEFRIILETYIHMQGPSCLTLTLILETWGRKNPNPNPRNPRKELKLFVKSKETLRVVLRNGGRSFSNCNWEIRQEQFPNVEI